jgi:prophage antirepressor-like protein
VNDGCTSYKFDGLEIRTVEDGSGALWFNLNDVLIALNMEPPDLSGTGMIAEADAFRIAQRCQNEDKFERFVTWLVEEVGVGPHGFRAATPVDDAESPLN